MKIALVATHPIQYHVPWYRVLAAADGVDLTVLYALLPRRDQQGIGFGTDFKWDIPLLDGYDYQVLSGPTHTDSIGGFFSIRTPSVSLAFRELKPDAVILTGWNTCSLIQAARAARARGAPTLVRGTSRPHPRPWWVRVGHRQFLRLYDAFLAIGSANRDFYRENGVPEDHIFYCPYFVDNRRFQRQLEEASPRRVELRSSWEIPEGTVCFLFAGKLIEKKRIMDLLAAVEKARGSRADVHLLIVGTGEQGSMARGYAREHDLPVTFVGFLNQTEITRAYAAADCLVLPSDWGETWGLVVNEAMACGLPAITSDRVGCAPDLIHEGETGFTFPFGDVRALGDRLVEAAADLDRLRRMGAAARELVEEHYTVEAAVEGTLEALRSLVPN